MKKILLLMFILTALSFADNYDGIGGASLNRGNTIKRYKKLTKMAKKAVKDNDWFLREQTIDEIENFIMTTESYQDVSSRGAKKNVAKFNKALKAQLVKLKKVDGMGGASLDPKKMMPRYNYVIRIIDGALKTGKNEEKAIEEAEDMLGFIAKWKAQQSGGAKSFLNRYEETLSKKLAQLKK